MLGLSALVHSVLALLQIAFLVVDIIYIARLKTIIVLAISIIFTVVTLIYFCYHIVTFGYLVSYSIQSFVSTFRLMLIPLFTFTFIISICSFVLATRQSLITNNQFFNMIGGFCIAHAIICIPEIVVTLYEECKKTEILTIDSKQNRQDVQMYDSYSKY